MVRGAATSARERMPARLGGPRAHLVWIVAILAYAIAVLQRTTMGVSGLEATERFGTSATIVSTFVVLQLLVYALAQIPAGLLLDRYGSRVTLVAGALLMGGGQLLLAHADVVGTAILARVVVGAGDALTFSSAIRLVPAWFPASLPPQAASMRPAAASEAAYRVMRMSGPSNGTVSGSGSWTGSSGPGPTGGW